MTEEQVFLAVIDLPSTADRTAYMDKACAGDTDFRRKVEDLLSAHFKSGDFLNEPVVQQIGVAGDDDHSNENTVDLIANPDLVALADEKKADGDDDENDLHFLQPATRNDALGRIGHYEVLQILGKGGFGIVFRAFDDVLQRVVAVKVLAPEIAATSPARKRFLREARSSGQVRHENVVQTYAVEEKPLPYLVMEFIPGETLQQRLDRNGPLDAPEILRLGRQIAEGLAAAHATGLIHRDIKPGNVLIESGPQEHIKITDFGLARAADDASQTQSGVLAGTPMYMAPEQARGERLDQRSDLFSLGSVLYVMASGRPPFRAPTTYAVLKRVVEDIPRPIKEVIPEVPAWLTEVIEKLHAKKPEDRFQSSREVADLLADYENQLRTSGRIKTTVNQKQPLLIPQEAKRSRWWKQILAAVLVFGLAAYGIYGLTHPAPQPVPTPAGETAARLTQPTQVSVQLFPESAGWVQLFNGRDLEGWTSGDFSLWSVHDGVLHGAGTKGYLHTTQANFQDFHLRAEVKAQAGSNSGIYFRSTFEGNQRHGYEADINLDPALTLTGSLLKYPSKNWLLYRELRPLLKPDVWSSMEIIAQGRHLVVKVDGVTTAELDDGEHEKGHIGLQLSKETTSDVQFRKIEIKELPAKAAPTAPAIDPDRRAADYVLSIGGTVKVNDEPRELNAPADLPAEPFRLTAVILNQKRLVSDAGLANFKGCKELVYLDLYETPVSEAGLAYFKDCKNLAWLKLEGTRAGDAGFAHFAGCKGLVDLNLTGAGVTDLSPLRGLPLRVLWCDFVAKRDADILRSIKTLQVINGKSAGQFWSELFQAVTGFAKLSDADIASIAALPAAEQVKRVQSEMKRFNPGFVGPLTPAFEDGAVTGLDIAIDDVSDLLPLRAFSKLKRLTCHTGAWSTAKLSDLSPLKGLPLERLSFHNTPVADLSPLKGMPLKFLDFAVTKVSDLSPLQGMPLEIVYCSFSRVSDLSPLKGMKLTGANFEVTQVSDLSPLQGMPLKTLGIYGLKRVTDISPLQGMPLIELNIHDTGVADIAPLKGMPLQSLNMPGTKITDLSPLKDMTTLRMTSLGDLSRFTDLSPLKDLTLDGIIVENFKPDRDEPILRATALKQINNKPAEQFWKEVDQVKLGVAPFTPADIKRISALPAAEQIEEIRSELKRRNPDFDGNLSPALANDAVIGLTFASDFVSDIAPIAALTRLQKLDVHCSTKKRSTLANLSPLKGLPLTQFNCNGTLVSDLSPLKGMPLVELNFRSTVVADLSAIQELPLTKIECDFVPARDGKILRSIRTLTTINDKPAAVFGRETEQNDVF